MVGMTATNTQHEGGCTYWAYSGRRPDNYYIVNVPRATIQCYNIVVCVMQCMGLILSDKIMHPPTPLAPRHLMPSLSPARMQASRDP